MMFAVGHSMTSQRLVASGLRRGGQRVAIVDRRRRVTFAEIGDRTARLANCLLAQGCSPERPVAALLGNRAEYIEVDLAAVRAGVPRVGLSDRLSPDEWNYILEDSSAATLVVTAELWDRMDPLPDTVLSVLIVDGGRDHPFDSRRLNPLGYERAVNLGSPRPPAVADDPDAVDYLLYTSGTTGRPKGACHSSGRRAAAALNMMACELEVAASSTMVHAGPLTHGSGSKVLAFFARGAKNVILERFDAESLAAAVTVEGGTHTFMVPTMLQRLLGAEPHQVAALRAMDQISFGGAPISVDLFRGAVESIGPRLVQVYGSCEAPHPITLLKPQDYRGELTDELAMSAGYPAVSTSVRLVDDASNEVPTGEVGELQVLAPHLMVGYWNNPKATAEALSSDGWYSTGDLGAVNSEGLLTLHDRKKDLIITGGLNVYPSEVERVLTTHPGVADAVVVGQKDADWGESIQAFIVTAPGTTDLTGEALTTWVRQRLAGYKKPKGYHFVETLPTGSSNKVLRRVLRENLENDAASEPQPTGSSTDRISLRSE
jgi:acyl-CoA synthetase (AMP-forming)/AMP-acid ligase II